MYLDGFDFDNERSRLQFLKRIALRSVQPKAAKKKGRSPFSFYVFLFHFYAMYLLGKNDRHLVDLRFEERDVVESIACL